MNLCKLRITWCRWICTSVRGDQVWATVINSLRYIKHARTQAEKKKSVFILTSFYSNTEFYIGFKRWQAKN